MIEQILIDASGNRGYPESAFGLKKSRLLRPLLEAE